MCRNSTLCYGLKIISLSTRATRSPLSSCICSISLIIYFPTSFSLYLYLPLPCLIFLSLFLYLFPYLFIYHFFSLSLCLLLFYLRISISCFPSCHSDYFLQTILHSICINISFTNFGSRLSRGKSLVPSSKVKPDNTRMKAASRKSSLKPVLSKNSSN